jgi:universal stress protein A
MLPMKNILVPIDWSNASNRAFQFACSLARVHDAQLVLINVVPLPAVIYGPPSECYLNHLHEELCRMKPTDPSARVRYLLDEGNPASAILRAAKQTNCDLIVMGTTGRNGLNRLIMGSVAEEVVRHAPCPVMTVGPDVHAESTPAD